MEARDLASSDFRRRPARDRSGSDENSLVVNAPPRLPADSYYSCESCVAGPVVRPSGGGLVPTLPPRARDDDARISRALSDDEAGEQVLNCGHAQRDERGAGRSPFFAAIAAPASRPGRCGRRA